MRERTFLLIFILMLTGCAIPTSATVSNNILFADRGEKIQKSVGLYISQKSRTYVAKQFVRKDAGMSDSGLVFTLDFGQNFEANSKRSLEKIFRSVIPLQTMVFAGGDYSHIIQIEIDDLTKFDIGTFAFSQKTVNLYMQCKLYNQSGKVLWEEMFNSETERGNVKGLLAAGIFGTYARQAGLDKLQEAAEENLWINLEMLNTRMLENQALFK